MRLVTDSWIPAQRQAQQIHAVLTLSVTPVPHRLQGQSTAQTRIYNFIALHGNHYHSTMCKPRYIQFLTLNICCRSNIEHLAQCMWPFAAKMLIISLMVCKRKDQLPVH